MCFLHVLSLMGTNVVSCVVGADLQYHLHRLQEILLLSQDF